MEKTDTVSKVLHNVTSFNSKYGLMYNHEIRFNNGDYGYYASKTETCTKFKEGEKVKYTIEANGNYPNKIKPVQEEQGKPNDQRKYSNASQEAIIAQSVYSSTCNRLQGSTIALPGNEKEFNAICEDRYQWVLSKIKA